MSDYNAGDKVRVEVEVTIPADASEEQVQEWIEFSIGNQGELMHNNPLIYCEPEVSGSLIR